MQPVLVTGAGSGIGLCLTRRLADAGHRVYATARRESDLSELATLDGVVPVRLEIRDARQIREAATFVERQGTGLYGLVNNAGLGGLGFLHTFTDAEMLELFDVNVFGPHRMTNAFLDLLLESRGRIVNVGSQGGTLTKPLFGPYTMTKHALEAYSTALGEELAPHGVRVSVIQAGGIVSRIGESSMPSTLARLERAEPPFRDAARRLMAAMRESPPFDETRAESESNRRPSPPEIVARAVEHALFSDRPRQRYLVGTRWEGHRIIDTLIDRLLEANESPELGHTREELIARIDQHRTRRSSHDD